MVLTQEQLEQKLRYWQKRLRLQDWIIEVRLVRERELDGDYAAQVNWVLPKKMASVHILDQIDYPPELMGERDMENDLVHELLHLHLAPIHEHFGEGNSLYSMFEEQAIESIAFGLVDAERNGDPHVSGCCPVTQ